jgi:anti-sigma regulatory factor (Ser/Thr protein kinase)
VLQKRRADVTKPRHNRDNPAVREFIIHNVREHPHGITRVTADRFGLSRMTVNRYLDKLATDGLVSAQGETKARIYKLVDIVNETFRIELSSSTEEHVVWRERVKPLFKNVPDNIVEMMEYCVTEMINNAIDHSESKDLLIHVSQDAASLIVVIADDGVGIFKKIARECHLNDEREAILELSKGKLTTDPSRHTGEGIFFTSRMVTNFDLISGGLGYIHAMKAGDDDWLIERRDDDAGTRVYLRMELDAKHTIREVYAKYETETDGYQAFSKTHVPVSLAIYPNEQLVSRSQARRVFARFNRFREVMLDFHGVASIGQAFADEIFRVFRNEHKDIEIIPVRMSKDVHSMIKRVAPDMTLIDPL